MAALAAGAGGRGPGDPISGLKWSRKALRKISQELRHRHYRLSAPTISRLLIQEGYSLRLNAKRLTGRKAATRNIQFNYLVRQRRLFLRRGWPVLSVDSKTVPAQGPAALRLAFTRGEGPPCKGEVGRTPASDERYQVRFAASVPAAQVYYPQVRGFLDRLLQRQVYEFVRHGAAPITLVVPYEPQDVAVIFKAPQRPDCVLKLHMEGPRYNDVTLVAGAQRLPAVPAAAPSPPPLLTCVFAAGPP